MGLPYMPISWGGARGVNGAAYMAVPWSVWDTKIYEAYWPPQNGPKHSKAINLTSLTS